MSNNNETSFWNFISNHTIEIPIIQRDYAQGRKGQEDLRKSLLKDLKEALTNQTPLKFDFVYGEENGDKVFPLDGQQRLTTLWLLHWYIALRAKKLAEAAEKLKKFTYETRVSSREFCHALCDDKNFKSFDGKNIVEFIQNQTWFYSFWRQDPTIQGMLTTLKGTGKQDGIEEVFKKVNFTEYWKKLTEDCKICFDYLPLKDFNLSDDLYIKMNARGKQLTPFENFKAELVGYIEKQKSPGNEWEKLSDPESDPENGFANKLDNAWTDIFWRNKSSQNKIDEIYYAFCNRFFLNALICQKKDDETEDPTFSHLYGKQGDDSKIEFSSLEYYHICPDADKPIPLEVLQSFERVLDNYKENENKLENLKASFPAWVEQKDFHFIPSYNKDNESTITTLTQKERVVFFAICRYLGEEQKFNEKSFEQWMRVVWNIVENSDISSISSMIRAMRLIDELSTHTHDIYDCLAGDTLSIRSDFAKDQVEEETIKAKKILEEPAWEEKIIKAENHAFFKGAIRFLFQNETGEDDWDNFDKKWENAQKYFYVNGGCEVKVLKQFISLVDREYDIPPEGWIMWQFGYDNKDSSWKNVLVQKKKQKDKPCIPYKLLHDFFMGESCSEKKESNWNDNLGQAHKALFGTDILDYIICKFPEESFGFNCRKDWSGTYALYPYNTRDDKKIIFLCHPRNKILAELCDEGTIKTKHRLELDKSQPIDFFWGKDVCFIYKEKEFIWDKMNWVYLKGKETQKINPTEYSENTFKALLDELLSGASEQN